MGRIEAKELRIGNLVKNNKPRHNDKILVIESIGDNDKVNVFFRDYDLIDLEPIPITEEWLLKFGFEITYSSSFRLKFDHNINYEVGFDFSLTENKSMEGFRFYGKYIKIQYVHQLQNLYFALTGEELTLKTD